MDIFSKTGLLLCFLMTVGLLCSGDNDQEEEPAFGGVSIKVFRGPSKRKGKEVFAPFGYYVKMPVADSSQYQKDDNNDDEDDNQSGEFDFKDDNQSADEELFPDEDASK